MRTPPWEPLGLNGDALHICLPAGIGDSLWVLSKLHALAAKRRIIFHLPDGEQHRAGEYLRLCGYECEYLERLTTQWVWRRPGQPSIPESGWVSLHANGHLEKGSRLATWYPEFPLVYPMPRLEVQDPCKQAFVLAFLSHEGYMEGQLSPREWAAVLSRLQRTIGPVRMVGAGRDVEFGWKVLREFEAELLPLFDRPLAEVLAAARSPYCRLLVGVAGGPTISGLVEGAPSWLAYPRWLARMPGTWEPPGSRWGWCHVQDLPKAVESGRVERLAR